VTDGPAFSGLTFDREGHEDDGENRGRRDRKLLRRVVLAVLVVAGVLYVAAYAFASDRLPRGTTIAGVDVGGQRPEQARQTLRNDLAEQMDEPIDVVVADQQFPLDPEEVGLDVDIPASVAQVPAGKSWNPAEMWESLVGGEDYEAVVVTVDDLLADSVEEIAGQVDDPPVEGAVAFTAEGPQPTYAEAGSVLDVEAAADAIRASYPGDGSPVELSMTEVTPQISDRAVSQAMERFANPAMSGPVTLVLAGDRASLAPADYAAFLTMEPRGDRLVPQVDGEQLVELVTSTLPTTAVEPQDASVEIRDGKPVVLPATDGLTVDEDELEKVFLEVAATTGGPRQAELPTKAAKPEVTTAEMRALGIKEEVSEFTTYYPHADYRNVNIGRAAEIIDGTILEPGETFSLNGTVGERTRENGFTEGFVISDGILVEDLGGGVSQVATTTFNAAFFAGLEDVEHKPHSFYIDRYPVGREATVAWPTVDLRFRNDTDHGVLIQTVHRPSTYSTQGALTVRMWSTKVWDIESRTGERYAYTSPDTRYLSGDDCVPNSGYSGFQVDVTRIFRRHGESEIHHTEDFHTTYIPSDSVVCS
jgi:vancomycin resistance protein YoaR